MITGTRSTFSHEQRISSVYPDQTLRYVPPNLGPNCSHFVAILQFAVEIVVQTYPLNVGMCIVLTSIYRVQKTYQTINDGMCIQLNRE